MSDEPENPEPETAVVIEAEGSEIEKTELLRIVEDGVQDEGRIIEHQNKDQNEVEVKVENERQDEVEVKVEDDDDNILGNLSAMTMEQLDDFLEENEEQEDGQPEEDEFEGSEEECEEEEEERTEEDEDGRMKQEVNYTTEYLKADNPLMAKFQATLKQHLLAEISKLNDEIIEAERQFETDLSEHRLAELELDRVLKLKEGSEKKIEELKEEINKVKKDGESRREKYEKGKQLCGEEKEKLDEMEKNYQCLILRTENLSRTAAELESLESKRQSELSIARIESAKSAKEIENLLSNDVKQDILSLMINREINKLERCLAECEDQQKAKHEETKTMAGNLADARADLASMQKENKKIDEAWNKIVASINMKQREYLDVQEDVRNVREKLRELQIGTTNTRRAWNEAKFDGERITQELVRFINEFNRFERTIGRKQKQQDELKRRVQMLNKIIRRDKLHIEEFCKLELKLGKELTKVSTNCDGLARKILKFEHEILEKYQTDYVVNNKELTAVSDEIRRLKRQNGDIELEIVNTEFKLKNIILEVDTLTGAVRKIDGELKIMADNIEKKIRHLETIEKKIENVKKQIGVKSVKIDQDCRKLEVLEQDLDNKKPKEKLILTLTDDIEELCTQIKTVRNQWLRKQTKLIELIEEHNENLKQLNHLECETHQVEFKLTKQTRCVEEHCQEQERLKASIERLIKHTEREMAKVLHTRDFESELNEETSLRKNEYYNQLQDAEAELYNLKQVISTLEEDEKSYLNQIEAAEQDYLSWDKKCTSAAKEKEKYEMEKKPGGEIEQLKREIHRMEMRYGQLKAAQKKLMNDLDACVTRRERIMDNVRARAKRNTKENTKKYLHEKKVQQLRNQVKQVQTEIKSMEKLSEEYKGRKEDLINENTNKENQLKSLQGNIDKIETQLQEGYLHKQKNLEILVRKQRRARHYSQIKDGKYRSLFRTEASLELETIKQSDTNQNLISLLETLLGDFPSLEYSLKKVLNTLKLNELITH